MFDCLVAQTSTRALWKYASMESGAPCVIDLIILGGDQLATLLQLLFASSWVSKA